MNQDIETLMGDLVKYLDPSLAMEVYFDELIPGEPAPKGSKRAFYSPALKRAVLVEASAKTKPWMSLVSWRAAEVLGDDRGYRGPVAAGLEFQMKRPKGHYRTGKNAGILKDSSPVIHTKKPDIDKLQRSTFDGLTQGGAYLDDNQVFAAVVTQKYAEHPGCRIILMKVKDYE